MLSLRRSLAPVLLALAAVLLIGTLGYRLLEQWSYIDALYMTVITLSTVGFGETRALSPIGRIFTIFLIVLGVSTVAYALSSIGEYILNVRVGPRVRERRIMRMINKFEDHFIICGFGRVGRSSYETLKEANRQIVIIEKADAHAEDPLNMGLTVVVGDATRDETLRNAGIEKAKGLVICGGSDSDNLFIVLSARALNPNLFIVARTVSPENESKMLRAGADRVVSPYTIGGRHMANLLSRPHVTDFLDVVTLDSGLELWLEELEIGKSSEIAGQTVIEADLRRRTGAILIALLRGKDSQALLPDESTRLDFEDKLIVLGTKEQLLKLQGLIKGK
ncbi:MAG: potassium channel protein [Candidatus Promineifilaceae bacterium]